MCQYSLDLPDPDDHESLIGSDEEPLLKPETNRSCETSISDRPDAIGLCHACCLPGVVAVCTFKTVIKIMISLVIKSLIPNYF